MPDADAKNSNHGEKCVDFMLKCLAERGMVFREQIERCETQERIGALRHRRLDARTTTWIPIEGEF